MPVKTRTQLDWITLRAAVSGISKSKGAWRRDDRRAESEGREARTLSRVEGTPNREPRDARKRLC